MLILIDDLATAPELAALARTLDTRVAALRIGGEPTGGAGPSDAALSGVALSDVGVSGVDRMYVPRGGELADWGPGAWAAVVVELIERVRPSAVLAMAGGRAAEVLTHTAARTGAPLATNCVAIDAGDRMWRVTRTRSGGVLLEDAELVADVPMATLGPGCTVTPAPPAAPAAAGECEVVEFAPELPADDMRVRLVERASSERGLSLATAPVVVSGGRGVGSAEGFAALEELADALGGVVGCSRVATSNGWRPHRDQVGLTGTKIAPELYIACGISGATQHWVGCMDAAVILAVNTDPEAPMMQRATYSVIGDVHEVVPALLAELGRRRRAASDGLLETPHSA
ncbi:hypothetical protein BJF85_10910 [Saccharomonospora sp. CUA-673]|uniref:electron transfer flavoprotein subunit alpha/FixB family protein n=1 Tax=Saccharomonospora sp. CUA-673 TaxID=1904969 RepID=UPI000965F8F7|nr:electron transfer flavoprotein subunit alpha/FixB family protein [Saccharomonospora sp. CUA-673]OLT49016.1 hypothetical protein BJF85_10910 [Saccharomonospora sp. CUA-673]